MAELRFGARLAAWGPQRLRKLDHELERAETIWPGPELIEAYVALRCWCVRAGHALGQKDHEADRWVAATAMWLGVSCEGPGQGMSRGLGLIILGTC